MFPKYGLNGVEPGWKGEGLCPSKRSEQSASSELASASEVGLLPAEYGKFGRCLRLSVHESLGAC